MASWVTGTYSHVDRLWSITPAVYASVYAYASGFDARASTMAALTWAWGIGLTYNFARKGGYSKGEQDYRWPVLREHPLLKHPVAWQAFNLGFIATYQHALLLLIARPSSAAYEAKGSELNALDRIAIALFAFFVAFESLADQQQWIFQQSKHRAPGHARQRPARRLQARVPDERPVQVLAAPELLRRAVRVGVILPIRGGGQVGRAGGSVRRELA